MNVFAAMFHLFTFFAGSCFLSSSNAAAEAFTVSTLVLQDVVKDDDTFRLHFARTLDYRTAPRPIKSQGLLSTSGGAEVSKPLYRKLLLKEMLAEFIGTFLIVQIGTGSVMSAVFTDSLVGLFQIASVWIISVTIAICTTASISGAHLNPAVSLAFALIRPSPQFNWRKVLPYSFAQLLGAVAASSVNMMLYGGTIAAYESANGIVRATSSGLASAKAFGEYFG